jgi:ketosteroid isomerase-like protein
MNNKKVVETFMEGYNTGDNAKILSCLSEDVIWELVGFFNLKGKDQFEKDINNEAASVHPLSELPTSSIIFATRAMTYKILYPIYQFNSFRLFGL